MTYKILEFNRLLQLDLPKGQSAFLWGARKTGKSSYLKKRFPNSRVYDLLNTEVYWRFLEEPFQLRQDILAMSEDELANPIVIDEVQMVPQLLNEVHWLIENSEAYFILCGSSARKLKKEGANMLGGRAWRYQFYPLVFLEIPDFDLLRALSNGLVPSHYQAINWKKTMLAYVQDYLTEEIKAEGLVRNLVAFSKFLKVAAHSNTELLNFVNVAQDCHVDSKTVKEYYQILVDTLLGYFIQPYFSKLKRKDIVASPKFYFFDVGVVNGLTGQNIEELTGSIAGHAFEHYILMELIAYKGLNDLDFDITFWRTHTGLEVDFILGDGEIAIEIKLGGSVRLSQLKGLVTFTEEAKPRRSIVVCQVPQKQKLEDSKGGIIELMPWNLFLKELWESKII